MSSATTKSIPASKILAGAAASEIEEDIACAKEFGFGVEIQHLAMPPWLGRDWREEADRLKAMLADVEGPIGLHGHFMDTIHVSPDPDVRDLATKRYRESMDMAEAIGAEFIVFHTQYNTALRLPDYPEIFHQSSLRYWPEIADEAGGRGIMLYLENMFDVDPEPSGRLARELDHPAFRLCLDVAHAKIHSDVPISKWIAEYGDYLGHIHINDCDGENDLHQELGEGILDLRAAIDQLIDTGLDLTYTLETRTSGRVSAAYLGIEPRS